MYFTDLALISCPECSLVTVSAALLCELMFLIALVRSLWSKALLQVREPHTKLQVTRYLSFTFW